MQGQAVNITPVWFTMKCDMYIQSVGIVCYIHWQLQVLKKNSSGSLQITMQFIIWKAKENSFNYWFNIITTCT